MNIKKTFSGAHSDDVFKYVNGCINGNILVNKRRIQACERFLNDLNNPKYEWNPTNADIAIELIQTTLVHKKGEDLDGKPLRGQPFILLPWQKFIIYNLLGIFNKGTIIEKYHEAIIFMPRKNGKTTFAAALAWAIGLIYKSSGSNGYIVAASQKQTLETFDFLKFNIMKNLKADKKSGGLFKITDNTFEHSIEADFGKGGSFALQALACNPDNHDSFNGNFAICDELHAWKGKKAKEYNLFRESMKGYSRKLLIGISTAGDDPNSYFAGRVDYCKRILDGEIKDEQLFAFLCEADDSLDDEGKSFLDYTSPKILEMSNPSYGISIRPTDILHDAIEAQNDPKQRKDFFAKSLNRFTAKVNTYFDIEKVKLSDSMYDWTIEDLMNLPIVWYGGVDLSKVHDLTAAVLYGRYKGIDICISQAFIPVSAAVSKMEEDNIPVYWWQQQGWLTICNSEVVEYDDVVSWFVKMRGLGFKIRWTGYDRRYAEEFLTIMKKNGFKVREQRQLYVEKTEGFREIEKKITTKSFYYLHNKAYEYCIGNVAVIEDSDDFVKYHKVSPNQRMDLFDASVIACKQLLKGNTKATHSVDFFD